MKVKEKVDTTLRGWSDRLRYGKHSGKTVTQLYTEDIRYLAWLINETDQTEFPPPMEYEILAAADTSYHGELN